MMFRPLSILSFVLYLSSTVVAFAPPAPTIAKTTSLPPLRMSDEMGELDPLETPGLALKMVGVLAFKTAKDLVNYPPKLLDEAVRARQEEIDRDHLSQANPVVMLFKFMGVLVFKMVHDAVYYPKVWTERLIECQSLEECELK